MRDLCEAKNNFLSNVWYRQPKLLLVQYQRYYRISEIDVLLTCFWDLIMIVRMILATTSTVRGNRIVTMLLCYVTYQKTSIYDQKHFVPNLAILIQEFIYPLTLLSMFSVNLLCLRCN